MTDPAVLVGLALLVGGVGGGWTAMPADTTPSSPEAEAEVEAEAQEGPRAPVLGPEWALGVGSVVEGAWSGNAAGVLQVVVAGVDAALPAGLSARAELMSKWGHAGLDFSPWQGLSSLDAETFAGPGEVWLQWVGDLAGAGLRVKVGRVDANTEFAATASAAAFANPSFGLAPTLALLPSYPDPAPSANVAVKARSDGPELGAGVYRRGVDAWSAVTQLAGAAPWLPSVVWSAGWVAPVGGGATEPAAGWVIVERPSSGGLAPFGTVSLVGCGSMWHVGGGVTAPVGAAGAPADGRLGLAASTVIGEAGHEETVVEALLSVRPLGGVVVQPHVQLRLGGLGDVVPAALLRVFIRTRSE